ncbi:MAG: hypothetical protein LBT84_05785, partial [Spirochaetia bacterium]|nr:hypothetical protein [Spirochaetia bacterium]
MKARAASPGSVSAARTFLPFAEEGFLLTLTTKGIYNRSLKDYESLEEDAEITALGKQLEVRLAGNVVTLNTNMT